MFKEPEYKILKNILLEVTEKYDQILNRFSSMDRELKNIRFSDDITKSLSKEGFLKKLQEILKKVEEENRQEKVAVIVADIDNFKYINDVYGYTLGDTFLARLAGVIENLLPTNGFFGRIGGDAFGIVIYGGSLEEYILFVEKLLEESSKFSIKIGNSVIKTTLSVGISIYPQDGKDPQHLLALSEQAMYISKSKGKNTYTIFNNEISQKFVEIEKYKSILNKAIEKSNIIPYIQPVFNLEKNKIIGGEVLIRIKHGDEILPAGKFIKVAEQFGIIDALEEKLLEKIIDDEFLKVFKGKFLFINKTINTEDKAEKTKQTIKILAEKRKKYHFVPVIEITENSFVEHFFIISDFISFARNHNVKIALDDFGAGYASFSYLLNFDIDLLKIDGTLVRDILHNKKSASIVKAISQIAKDFRIKTIAEYAESKEIMDMLKEIGIHCAQGYFISKPIPLEEFKELIS